MPSVTRFATQGRPVLRDGQESFAGGLNTVADQLAVGADQVRRADNARMTDWGGIMKRLGLQRVHAAALQSGAIVRGGFGWLRTDGTCEQLAVVNGVLHTGTYGVPMTWTAQTGALSGTEYPDFAEFVDAGLAEVVYLADGGQLNRWNGTALAVDLASTPTGLAGLAVFNRRLWAHTRTRLFYSARDNGDTLGITGSGGGEIFVRTFGAEEVRMIAVVGSSLLIGHPRGFSRLAGWGQDDTTVEPQAFSSDQGVVSRRAWCLVEGRLMFLSQRGLYQANEASAVPVATAERPDPTAPVLAQLTQAELDRVVLAHNPRFYEVWCYLPDRGVYVYNYRLGAWTGPLNQGYTLTPTHAMWTTQDAAGRAIVLVGDSAGWVKRADAPGIYRDNVGSNGAGGDLFPFAVRIRRLIFGDPTTVKALRRIYVYGDLKGSTTASVRFSAQVGGGSGLIPSDPNASSWGAGTWGTGAWGAVSAGAAQVEAWGQGNYMEVEIADDGAAESSYSRIVVEAQSLGRRRR